MAVLAVVTAVVESRVPYDRVEPGLGLDRLVAAEGAMGLDKRILDDVFGTVVAGDGTGVGDECTAIAVHEFVECGFYSAAEEFYESAVGLHAQRSPCEGSDGCRGDGLH